MSCIKSLPEICRLGIARVGIRTLLLVLFTCVMQHTAVLLGNSSTLNKRGENPPRCNRTTPADFSLANPAVNAQTIFSFSAVMAFHEALTTAYSFIGNFPFASAMSKSRFRSRAMRYGTDEQIPPTFFHWSCCHPACMSEKRRSVKTGQLPARP